MFGFGIIYTVKEKQEVIIESFGKYVKTTQEPGLHVKLPWPFQKIAQRIPTDVHQIEDNLKTKTKDDIFVQIPIKVQLQVVDTKKYHYNNNDPTEQLKARIIAAMKQETADMDFANLYKGRVELRDTVLANVGPEVERDYGVKLVDVIVDEPKAPDSVEHAYNAVRASEREAQAKVNNAKAEKEAAILYAEGERERLRLQGLGVAEQRGAVIEKLAQQFNQLASEGMPPEMAYKMVRDAMQQDTLRDIASHGNMIVTGNGGSGVSDSLADIEAAKQLAKAKQAANENGGAAAKKPAAPGQ
jgi:regulator of protease activity HflC (stomatin/prohibitin superfamily)